MSRLTIECLEAAKRPDRLYPVRTHEGYGFDARLAADGRQGLAAVDGHALLVVLFDAGGDLRESQWWDRLPGQDVEGCSGGDSGGSRRRCGSSSSASRPARISPRTRCSSP